MAPYVSLVLLTNTLKVGLQLEHCRKILSLLDLDQYPCMLTTRRCTISLEGKAVTRPPTRQLRYQLYQRPRERFNTSTIPSILRGCDEELREDALQLSRER